VCPGKLARSGVLKLQNELAYLFDSIQVSVLFLFRFQRFWSLWLAFGALNRSRVQQGVSPMQIA
jgi:hypothetical protein